MPGVQHHIRIQRQGLGRARPAHGNGNVQPAGPHAGSQPIPTHPAPTGHGRVLQGLLIRRSEIPVVRAGNAAARPGKDKGDKARAGDRMKRIFAHKYLIL